MLRRVGWSFAVVSAIYAAQVLIRGFALWRTNLARQLRYWDVLLIRLATEVFELFTLTGPFVAEPAKGWLLRRRGIDTAVAYGAVLTEFLLYTVVSAALQVVALAFLITRHTLPPAIERSAWVIVLLTLAFLTAFACAAATGVGIIVPILRAIGALSRWPRVTLAAGEFGRVEDRIISVLRNRAQLVELFGMETTAQTPLVAEIWILIRALGFSASWLGPIIVEGGSKFVGIAFAFIPGQFGASEGQAGTMGVDFLGTTTDTRLEGGLDGGVTIHLTRALVLEGRVAIRWSQLFDQRLNRVQLGGALVWWVRGR